MEKTLSAPITVLLSPTGQMATFQNEAQRTDLQEPWILMVANYFKERGIDPTQVDFSLPDGRKIKIVELKTAEGYNWTIT